MSATYADKLNDKRWKSVRKAVLKSLGSKCQECGSKKRLEIHKCAYVPRVEPWEQPQDLMMVLCRTCHQERQNLEDGMRVVVGRITRTMTKIGVENMFWRLSDEAAFLERMKSNEGNL